MYYVGVDMAVEKHDICLMASDGRVLSEVTIANSSTGFEELHRLLDSLDVTINLERPDGILVDWLASEEYRV